MRKILVVTLLAPRGRAPARRAVAQRNRHRHRQGRPGRRPPRRRPSPSPARPATARPTTDAEGGYRFLAVDPGTYSVTFELTGFQPKRQDNVVVTIGRTADVHVALGVGAMTESVDVVGEAPVVDATLERDREQPLAGHAVQPADPADERRHGPAQLPARASTTARPSAATPTTATRCSSTASTPATPSPARPGPSSTTTSSRRCRSAASAPPPSTAPTPAPSSTR